MRVFVAVFFLFLLRQFPLAAQWSARDDTNNPVVTSSARESTPKLLLSEDGNDLYVFFQRTLDNSTSIWYQVMDTTDASNVFGIEGREVPGSITQMDAAGRNFWVHRLQNRSFCVVMKQPGGISVRNLDGTLYGGAMFEDAGSMPSSLVDGDGILLVFTGAGRDQIHIARVQPDAEPDTSVIDKSHEEGIIRRPVISGTGDGRYFILYTLEVDGGYNLNGMLVNSDLAVEWDMPVDSNIEGTASRDTYVSDILGTGNSSAIVVSYEKRYGSPNHIETFLNLVAPNNGTALLNPPYIVSMDETPEDDPGNQIGIEVETYSDGYIFIMYDDSQLGTRMHKLRPSLSGINEEWIISIKGATTKGKGFPGRYGSFTLTDREEIFVLFADSARSGYAICDMLYAGNGGRTEEWGKGGQLNVTKTAVFGENHSGCSFVRSEEVEQTVFYICWEDLRWGNPETPDLYAAKVSSDRMLGHGQDLAEAGELSAIFRNTTAPEIDLEWTPNSYTYDKWIIERAGDSSGGSGGGNKEGSYYKIGETNQTVFTDSKPDEMGEYIYRVYSVYGPDKGGYSQPSGQVTASFLNRPEQLRLKLVRTGDIILRDAIEVSFTNTSGKQEGFIIERSENGLAFNEIATTTEETYMDQLVEVGEVYYYRVKAYNSGSESGYSDTAFIDTSTASSPENGDVTDTSSPQSTFSLIKGSSYLPSRCYVATAAAGNTMETAGLRRFRSGSLVLNGVGIAASELYDRCSQKAALLLAVKRLPAFLLLLPGFLPLLIIFKRS